MGGVCGCPDGGWDNSDCRLVLVAGQVSISMSMMDNGRLKEGYYANYRNEKGVYQTVEVDVKRGKLVSQLP